MSNTVIVGSQWGDEGKAKVIDYLAKSSDIIVRFHGGANAGHTVIVDGKKFVFHMVPSGIMYKDKICVISNGVVFDAEQFLREVDELAKQGVSIDGRIYISETAHLVLPYHKAQDNASEKAMGDGKIGTTGKGIGPAYADKTARNGIRVADLVDWDVFVKKFTMYLEQKKTLIKSVYKSDLAINKDEVISQYESMRARLLPYITDTAYYLFNESRKGKSLLFEGAQGTFLDIDHGTYPFVTSSSTVSGCASSGSGIGPSAIHNVVGIVKVYTTRVGSGPFPTELNDAAGKYLQDEGGEFGATTGRPRRCGWFDSVMVRKSVQVNGINRFALTKLDVLNKLDEIKICTHYEINGKKVDQFPSRVSDLEKAIPVYESMDGWKCDISECRTFDDLPSKAHAYIKRLQSLCYDVPLLMVSIGPDRNQTIEVNPL